MAFQRLLIVDNHDSFTYNLVEYVRRVSGHEPMVVPNDTPWARVDLARVDAVIISPGPGTPANPQDLGITADIVREFPGPILGVCLGMQAMVHLGGGIVTQASRPAHGERALINHEGTGIFRNLPDPLPVVRYHSLVATEVPEEYRVTAALDGVVMAIEHAELPRWGVQFHPESVMSDSGEQLIANFLELAGEFYAKEYFLVTEIDYALDPVTLLGYEDTLHSAWLDYGRFSIVAGGAESFSYDLSTATEDFFDMANAEFAARRAPARVGNPIPGCDFALGWVGYLGYEMGQLCGAGPMPAAPGPDAEFFFASAAWIIDNDNGVTYLLQRAEDRLPGLEYPFPRINPLPPRGPVLPELRPVHSREEYLTLIGRAQEQMRRGESYEVCLTNRLETSVPIPDEELLDSFEWLRNRNLTGRNGFLHFPGNALLSTSPELFLSVDHWGVVRSEPIKGTRPRDPDPARDKELRAELETGEKERSELLMVVDMVRHDLSRVCTDVRVPSGFNVASYPTVHQLYAEVTGRLRPEATPIDALRAAFPGGSMTGAPKERTMAIISELEGTWRGAYSGAYGFLSITGTMDFSMTIRTLVTNERGSSYGVGGAILALSDPQEEWEETQVKARPLTAGRVATPDRLDSFLVREGHAIRPDLHRRRFGEDYPDLGPVPKGEWFPRVTREGVDWRPAPPLRTETVLWLSAEADPRLRPRIKGPDLTALARLRSQAQEVGADDAVLLDAPFSGAAGIREAAHSALVFFRDGRPLMACEDEVLFSTTVAATIEAGLLRPPLRERLVVAHVLECPAFTASALHGWTPVTAWVLPDGTTIQAASMDPEVFDAALVNAALWEQAHKL